MKGIIAYNRSYRTGGVSAHLEMFQQAFQRVGIPLSPHCGLSAGYDRNGDVVVDGLDGADFVLFWDKDVRLCRALEKHVPVFNSSDAIAVCDDKVETFCRVAGCGIAMPETIAAPLVYPREGEPDGMLLDAVGARLGFPLVVKECNGSLGAQVSLVKTREELYATAKRLLHTPHLYQEYLSHAKGRDLRYYYVGGEIVACTVRTNDADFRSNVEYGGVMSLGDMRYRDEAKRIAKRLGLTFGSVDFLESEGKPYFCEANTNAFFYHLYELSGIDLSQRIAETVLAHMGK